MYDYESIIMDCHTCAEIGCGRRECSHKDADGCEAQLLIDAACAIEELVAERDQFRGQAKMVPKWVSVEERLPQKRYAVLAYCPYNKCIYTAYWDGENWVHFGGGNIEYVSFPVTHWMPLPEPPKGVE